MLTDDEKRLIYEQIATAKAESEARNREARAIEIRNSLLLQISQDAGRLNEQLVVYVDRYQNLANAVAATNERIEDLHARQGAIDQNIKLILEIERAQVANIKDEEERRELEKKIDAAQGLSLERASIQRRLNQQTNNLHILEEQAAKIGTEAKLPLDLINQIADTRGVVQQLQTELKRIKD